MQAVPGYPNLNRRNGTYYLYKRVPQGLLEAFNNRLYVRKSLRTKDLSEAKKKLHKELVLLDEEFDRAREGLRDTLTHAEAKAIAEARLKDKLIEDMALREQGDQQSESLYPSVNQNLEKMLDEEDAGVDTTAFFTDQDATSDFGLSLRGHIKREETVAWLKPHYRQALARQDLSAVSEEVDELSAEHRLDLKHGSESWRNLAREVLGMWVRYIDVLERRNSGDPDEFDLTPPPISSDEEDFAKAVNPTNSAGDGITLDELIGLYIKDPSRSASDRTNKGYEVIYRTIRDVMGADKNVLTITRQDCRAVKDALLKTPVNALQRFPNKDTFEVIKLAEEREAKLLSPATINNRLRNMSALFKWAVREDYMVKNPAADLSVHDPVKARDKRRPFTEDELQKIFSAPLYTGCQSEYKYHLPGNQIIKKGRYWVPLISLWTGMRLGECCQLHCDDVQQIEGVWCLIIKETKDGEGIDEADRKRVKTASGERFVPIHSELEKLGFIKFALSQKNRKHVRLFPELKPSADGYLSNNFSKWFNDKNRFLGKIGLAGQGGTFHSFRHNYRDAMRRAKLDRDTVLALGGWATGETDDNYGNRALSAKDLKQQIEKITYKGLKLPSR